MLWQTAMLVVIVLFLFAAVGTAAFANDFALSEAVEAGSRGTDDFQGCESLGEVRFTSACLAYPPFCFTNRETRQLKNNVCIL